VLNLNCSGADGKGYLDVSSDAVFLVMAVLSYLWVGIFSVIKFVQLQRRVAKLEVVIKQFGPTAEARLQDGGTKVDMPEKWFDEQEEPYHG